MKILSIETSCDETAISVVEATGGLDNLKFEILGNSLFSQIAIHQQYGGVYPMIAKREHAKNLPPILKESLTSASLFKKVETSYKEEVWEEIKNTLSREEGLYDGFRKIFENIEKPNVDIIGVTSGPGLAPALWVGISFAQALGKLWNIPVVGINHMEGHITSVLAENSDNRKVEFPALALLISGGHTEIVEIKNWGQYNVIGQTKDDAVGEAFDKVARMLDLPYPGGVEISRLAEYARQNNIPHKVKLPRPMLHSKDLNFSFSGLKTAVLYYIRDNWNKDASNANEEDRADLAREFEDSIIEVLVAKVEEAIKHNDARTLIIGGGVIANKRIREVFMGFEKKFNGLIVKTPVKNLATDNAIMIACATYVNILLNPELINQNNKIVALGNVKLGKSDLN